MVPDRFVIAALFATACSSSPSGDPPQASGAQFEVSFAGLRTEPLIYVFVADDHAEARPLREEMAKSFSEFASRSHDACPPPFDPAAWHVANETAIIVRPSETGDARFVTPSDDPRLHWQSQQRTQAEAKNFSDAVSRALLGFDAPAGAPYPVLQALSQTHGLLVGTRIATTSKEAEIVATKTKHAAAGLILASAADDASPDVPASYAVRSNESQNVYFSTAIVPALHPNPSRSCDDRRDLQTSARFSEFLETDATNPLLVETWPCTDLILIPELESSCVRSCLRRTPAIDDVGRSACRIRTHVSAEQACPAELGWLDPIDPDGVRRPREEKRDGTSERICELPQLEGGALDACRNTLACDGCVPGWCWTEVPELAAKNLCAFGYPASSFRLIGGATEVGSVSIVCNATSE